MVNESASRIRTEHTAARTALRLLLADDHEMVRMAMRYALAPLSDSIVWHEAADAAQVYSILDVEPELDLAIVDLRMPGATGIEWIRSLRAKYPLLPLLVISATEDSATVKVLIGCGVAGFIPKSDPPAVILQAVRLVLAGGTYAPLRLMSDTALGAISKFDAAGPTVAGLTPRQREVLNQLARGLPNKRIARELGMSESTVKVHLLAIYRVLAVAIERSGRTRKRTRQRGQACVGACIGLLAPTHVAPYHRRIRSPMKRAPCLRCSRHESLAMTLAAFEPRLSGMSAPAHGELHLAMACRLSLSSGCPIRGRASASASGSAAKPPFRLSCAVSPSIGRPIAKDRGASICRSRRHLAATGHLPHLLTLRIAGELSLS